MKSNRQPGNATAEDTETGCLCCVQSSTAAESIHRAVLLTDGLGLNLYTENHTKLYSECFVAEGAEGSYDMGDDGAIHHDPGKLVGGLYRAYARQNTFKAIHVVIF